jgi:hypothetical protein
VSVFVGSVYVLLGILKTQLPEVSLMIAFQLNMYIKYTHTILYLKFKMKNNFIIRANIWYGKIFSRPRKLLNTVNTLLDPEENTHTSTHTHTHTEKLI